jgi:hypothetical protein
MDTLIKEACSAAVMDRMPIRRYFKRLREIEALGIRARHYVRVLNIVKNVEGENSGSVQSHLMG